MRKDELLSYLEERREHERLDRNFKLRYGQIEDLSKIDPDREGELLDIGGGGIRLLAEDASLKDSQLMIVMEIPGWQVDGDEWTRTRDTTDIGVLRVIGNVMWCAQSSSHAGKHEIGVRFTGQIL